MEAVVDNRTNKKGKASEGILKVLKIQRSYYQRLLFAAVAAFRL